MDTLYSFYEWLTVSLGVRLAAGAIFIGLFGWLYFRITKGFGKSIFLLTSFFLAGLFIFFPYAQILSFPLLLLATALASRFRRPKRNYEHAVARVEGGGVKRGLTPPEAAILLGAPFNVSLILVIFGLLRKGIFRQTNDTPLVVNVAGSFKAREKSLSAEQRANLRRDAAQEISRAMYPYEELFIELFEQNADMPVYEIDFSILARPFVQLVAERMAGYDFEETREYYHLIIKRAPKEARSDGVLVSERQKVFDRNLLWILLNDRFQEILDGDGHAYIPVWLRSDEQEQMRFGKHDTFGLWAVEILEEMKAAVPKSALQIKLGKEIDNVTAKLMAEISQATFYG